MDGSRIQPSAANSALSFAFRTIIGTVTVCVGVLVLALLQLYVSYTYIQPAPSPTMPYVYSMSVSGEVVPPARSLFGERLRTVAGAEVRFASWWNATLMRMTATADADTGTPNGVAFTVAADGKGQHETAALLATNDGRVHIPMNASAAESMSAAGPLVAYASLRTAAASSVALVGTGVVAGLFVQSLRTPYTLGADRNGTVYPAVWSHGTVHVQDGGNVVVAQGGDVLTVYANATDGATYTASLLQHTARLTAQLGAMGVTSQQLAAQNIPLWTFLRDINPLVTPGTAQQPQLSIAGSSTTVTQNLLIGSLAGYNAIVTPGVVQTPTRALGARLVAYAGAGQAVYMTSSYGHVRIILS